MPHATERAPRAHLDTTEQALRDHLDGLAHWVATRLDAHDDTSAWTVTTALERATGTAPADELLPRGPAIGRRFAQAHRRLLELARAGEGAAVEAALTIAARPPADQSTTATAAA